MQIMNMTKDENIIVILYFFKKITAAKGILGNEIGS